MHTLRRIYSVGHSTRTLPAFLDFLRSHGIRGIADVRVVPASGRQPWFNRQPLSAALRAEGFAYDWLGEELGGGREDAPGRAFAALKEAHERGYAAHMATPLFARGVERLLELASRRTTALMCAEAAPEGCHRPLLCDALQLRGVEVLHAVSEAEVRPHRPHPAMLPRGLVPTYPPRQASLF